MEIGQLRALRELRDRGSIAAVAATFRVSPSAVSQQLAALQRSVGVALTRLEGRRTVLTNAGLALAEAAIGVETALIDANEAVARFQRTPAARVSVSALTSVGLAFFPTLLTSRLPGEPELELTDRDVGQAEYARLTAEIDLVIAHRMPGGNPWPRSVASVQLLTEPLDLAVRAGHPLAGSGPVTAAELDGVEWISVHQDFPLADSLSRISALGGHEAVVRHQVNDFAVVAALLAVSDCVALLPRHTGQPYLAQVCLRPLSPELAVQRRIDILARPETLHRAAVRTVLAALQQQAQKLGGS